MAELFISRGIPDFIRSDNGPEFIADILREWLQRLGVKTLFIEPGSPDGVVTIDINRIIDTGHRGATELLPGVTGSDGAKINKRSGENTLPDLENYVDAGMKVVTIRIDESTLANSSLLELLIILYDELNHAQSLLEKGYYTEGEDHEKIGLKMQHDPITKTYSLEIDESKSNSIIEQLRDEYREDYQ